MSKREASMFAAQGVVDIDAPRAKRHKPGPQTSSTSGGQSSSPAKDVHIASSADGKEVKQEQLESAVAAETVAEDPQVVKEKGMKVWQAVKDAVNKEGLVLSTDFMRLPSKRQYADYYAQIKHPISLDEIKERLDDGAYISFNDCVNDLETCFKNAKRYNVRDSLIWKSAKVLHKLVTQEAAKLSGKTAVGGQEDPDASGALSDPEGDGAKKKKQPNMGRLLKTRLQKLVDKTDSDGRVLSTEFMELPNRKQWAVYYKTIKKPQCLENIFKKLKRKEYHTTLDFANDVELVFSNATEFNQEHTGIWEDAVVLRDYFRQLMADLPAPFSIPAYASSDHSTKIKLRMPHASHPQHSPAASNNPNPVGGTLMLRVPPQASPSSFTPQLPNSNSIHVNVGKSPKVTPTVKTKPLVSEPNRLTPAPSATPQPAAPHVATPAAQSQQRQQITFAQSTFPSSYVSSSHYPHAVHQPPPQPSQTRTPIAINTALPNASSIHSSRQSPSTPVQTQVLNLTPVTNTATTATAWSQTIVPRPPPALAPAPPATYTAPSMGAATVSSKSPTPVTASRKRKMEYVVVMTKPNGRRLDLDARDGVKTWAVRLGVDELSVNVSGVRFFAMEEGAEENGMYIDGAIEARKEEEEEGEEEESSSEVVKVSPKRGRGRPRKKPLTKEEPVKARSTPAPKSKTSPADPAVLQIRLNGSVTRPLTEGNDEWEVKVPVGYNVLEIGESGGVTWRVYLERMAGTHST